jgi:ribokinase
VNKIVVIGSLNMDLVGVAPRIPAPGETVIGRDFFQVAGGKGANQAYAASMLGGSVAMLGRVGTDDYGQFLRAGLKAAGCDVSLVRAVEGPSGIALILVSDAGENSILVAPGANGKYALVDFEADADGLTGAALVLLQLETPLETVTAAALAARRAGARVILDPAPAPDGLPDDLLRSVDILTPNEVEAAQLAGQGARDLSLDDAEAIARRLLARGVGAAIIKLGARGCLLAEGESMSRIPAPPVNAIDTTAAGDVFNGALAVALSEGALLEEACRFAVRAAALSVTRMGAQSSMPRRDDIDRWNVAELPVA